nr:uncharacterized protein LOC120973458 [Aegilops tauschii subsp. strangulata]
MTSSSEIMGDDPKRKPQDKPAKTTRPKTKVTKKPAKKKTAESTELNIDDDDDNHESEDDAEASHAGDAEGTSHSSSSESTGTQIPTLKTVPGAEARASKRAKVNKPAENNIPTDPEQTPEQSNPNTEAILDDPPPQDHEILAEHMEAELSKKESQIADLQENIKSQQAETSKAKDELTSALAAMEKLKESFKNERAGWDTEKTTLLKKAEDAEAALNPVTEELTGLKRQINAMTAAVFGK